MSSKITQEQVHLALFEALHELDFWTEDQQVAGVTRPDGSEIGRSTPEEMDEVVDFQLLEDVVDYLFDEELFGEGAVGEKDLAALKSTHYWEEIIQLARFIHGFVKWRQT